MNNDLISRSALKKQFAKKCVHNCYYCKSAIWDKKTERYNCGLIDNAPAVDPEKVLIANVTFDEEKLKDSVQTEVIEKIKSGELVIKDERPQGKWIKLDSDNPYAVECPFCNARHCCVQNFCGNCGADMRKGKRNE